MLRSVKAAAVVPVLWYGLYYSTLVSFIGRFFLLLFLFSTLLVGLTD